LPLVVIEYQTAILRQDFVTAESLLPSIPDSHRNRIAHFLDSQGLKKQAISVSFDSEHRFELAMQLSDLQVAYGIATELGHEHKLKTLGDAALAIWDVSFLFLCNPTFL
jgi:coatomer subunit beta'